MLVGFLPGVIHGWEYFRLEHELSEVFGRPVDLATKQWMKPASSMRRDEERTSDILEALGADRAICRVPSPETPLSNDPGTMHKSKQSPLPAQA